MADEKREMKRPPGACVPWEEKKKEFPQITGDQELVKRQWEEIDAWVTRTFGRSSSRSEWEGIANIKLQI